MRILSFFLLIACAAASIFRNASKLNQFEPPFHIKAISLYGLETNLRNTVCSWVHPAPYYIEKFKELGFNSIRIPVSVQYIVEGNYDVLDSIVKKSDDLGLNIVIDIHRIGNNYQEANPDKGIQEYGRVNNRDEMMVQIIKILTRYVNSKSVGAIVTWNEYTGMDVNYKRDYDTHFIEHVQAAFGPDRFFFFVTGLLWGGILSGYTLEDKPFANKVIYSVHKYHFSGTGNRQDWEVSFGNAFPPHKMVVGEFGFRNPQDLQFGREFTQYLVDKGIKNWAFWTIAHSGDTGGLWFDNCIDIDWTKYDILKKLLNQ
jgi:aryl-phospho-beta-D-glucosidase BglC (GH1 family)